jgi:ABC-type bacteriocin/lantibiotic exporter with double-glycine peptidase domain
MFEPEWMEYFEREAPFSYYCLILLGYLGKILFYSSYLILLIVLFIPLLMIYSGTKAIKIKLVEDKKHKKLRKEKEKHEQLHQNLYLDHLDRKIKKKKKHK